MVERTAQAPEQQTAPAATPLPPSRSHGASPTSVGPEFVTGLPRQALPRATDHTGGLDVRLPSAQRPAVLMALQRAIGNAAVQQLLGPAVESPRPGIVGRVCACGGIAGSDGACAACHARSLTVRRQATPIFAPPGRRLAPPPTLQRQDANAGRTTPNGHVGVIPVREFIRHVETVEQSFPGKQPQEILTMIRSLYYGSPAGSPGFDRLIPDAPATGAVEMCSDSEGSRCTEAIGTCVCVYAHGLAMETPELREAVRRLRQRANENAVADNPSPYIQTGADLIDVGHLLVGIDAVLHPRTEDPFQSHGLTSAAGPATWEGDVGAAMVYLKEHELRRQKSPDVVGNPSPTVEDYYQNSMPRSDLLGDVDAFGMAQLVGPQTLSTALRYQYVGESGGAARVGSYRWRAFASATGLTYSAAGSTITWQPQARQTVIDRISRFANLFAGRQSPIRAMTLGIGPQQWERAGPFADRFLRDVKQGLEEEAARNPGG